MSKLEPVRSRRRLPTRANIEAGSELAAKGSEQKVNSAEMTACLRHGGAMKMGTAA